MFINALVLASAGLLVRVLVNHWLQSTTGIWLAIPREVALPVVLSIGLGRLLGLLAIPIPLAGGFLALDLLRSEASP